MYRDVRVRIARLATVLICAVIFNAYAGNNDARPLVVKPYAACPFTTMKYADAVTRLHAGCSKQQIMELLSLQGGEDKITRESMCDTTTDELVVLPDNQHVLPLRTVLKLILTGHSYNPFTRKPFSEQFCEALTALAYINCTARKALHNPTIQVAESRSQFILELCNFYMRPRSEDLMQPMISLLQTDERRAMGERVGHEIQYAGSIIHFPELNREPCKVVLENIAATAQFHDEPYEYHSRAEQMLERLKAADVKVSRDMTCMVQRYWITPLRLASKALHNQDALLDYGIDHARRLLHWRHWKTKE